MSCSTAIDEFHRLVREAHEADTREEQIEPHLVRLLASIKGRPECRNEYAAAFRALIEDRTSVPWELVPFCMHELRWDDVRTVIEERYAEARKCDDWRAVAVYSKYLDGFRDDWESADMFQYFSGRDSAR